MSIAPLRSLRSFWAAGGAPGALFRRDAQLRERLERIAANAPGEGPLTDGRSYAALLRSLDLNDVFASERTEHTAPVDVMPEQEHRRHHASPPLWRDIAHSRSDRSSPTNERAARALSDAQGREPDDEIMRTAKLRAAVSAVASRRVSGKGSPVALGERRADRDDFADHGVDAVRRHRRQLASFLDAIPQPRWRDVPPVARDTAEQSAAAVARILAAADPAHIGNADEAARSDRPSRTQHAQSPSDQLAKTVQRAERRLAEQRSTTASRASSSDRSYEPAAMDREREIQRDDWMSADYAVNAEMPNGAPSRPTGIRGLAVRSLESLPTMRAPLFGLIPNGSVDWPSSDIDQFSSALDDAARREGVELGELDT